MNEIQKISDIELIEVLKNSLYAGASDASIKLVKEYCNAAGLDVMQKPVHINESLGVMSVYLLFNRFRVCNRVGVPLRKRGRMNQAPSGQSGNLGARPSPLPGCLAKGLSCRSGNLGGMPSPKRGRMT